MKGRPPEQSTSPPAAGEQHVKKRRPRRREDPCERVDCQQHACMVCGRGWCSESASCRGSRWRSGGCRSTRFQVADSVSYVRIGEDDTLFPWARSGRGTHRPAAGCAGIGRSSGLPITVCSLPVAGRRPRSKLHFHRYLCIFCALHAHASLASGCKSTVQGASRSTTNPLNSHLPLAGFRVAAKGCLY